MDPLFPILGGVWQGSNYFSVAACFSAFAKLVANCIKIQYSGGVEFLSHQNETISTRKRFH